MLILGLLSTSDDWLSDLSNKSQPKCKERPPKSSKIEMPIFGLCSTSDDQPSNLSNESWPKCIKRPPKSSKNQMLIFGLCSTSDNLLSDLSNESWPKCNKRPPKSSKNEMLIFGLCSTSDDWLSDLSDESQPKCEKGPLIHKKVNSYFWITFNFWWSAEQSEWQKSTKMQKRPLSHQKIKCSFLDYVQLLMICRVIWVTKVNCNANKGPLSHQKINSHFWITFNFWWSAEQSEWQKSTTMQKRPSKSSKNEMLIFGLCSTSDDWPSDLSDESQPKCKIRPP